MAFHSRQNSSLVPGLSLLCSGLIVFSSLVSCQSNHSAHRSTVPLAENRARSGLYAAPVLDANGRVLPTAQPENRERYAGLPENPFLLTTQDPLSTFSIDVDTGSYSNVRRFLTDGELPPVDAVRIEEMINYFDYDYPAPAEGEAVAVNLESASCPWAPDHLLLRIGLRGAAPAARSPRPPCNLVFLIDVSGSMDSDDKLPLLKRCMTQLVRHLDVGDHVGIVTYSNDARIALNPTPIEEEDRILRAISGLHAAGSTNGADGIQKAYALARKHALADCVSRVILATDGDFNVGVTSHDQLVSLVSDQARTGVYLTVLGFGTGNLNEAMLEQLADKGNGHYAYIDSFPEGRRVLVQQSQQTLVPVARDVKAQVEFNPACVAAYRLLGYENRLLAASEFNDDRKDAGELGAGQEVTALYEVVPVGVPLPPPSVDSLRYQHSDSGPVAPAQPAAGPVHTDELAFVKVRYQDPFTTGSSRLITQPVHASENTRWQAASPSFRLAAAVAGLGLMLRDSRYAPGLSYTLVSDLAATSLAADPDGVRHEFMQLTRLASDLDPRGPGRDAELARTR